MEEPHRTPASDMRRIVSEAVAHLGPAADRRVLQQAMRTGLWTWPAFTALDAYMCFVAFPGAPFGLFVLYRVLIQVVFFAIYWASFRETVGVKRLFRWQSTAFGATAFTISLMAVHLGGVRSPYMHGISIVALVCAALLPTHWRRGLPTLLPVGLAFPIVMGVVAAFDASARADWITRDALTVFTSNYVFVLVSSMLSVILGHLVWKAQQEARNLGSYDLEELLGRGGMGEVWRARHHLLAREAAIKVIRPEVLGSSVESRQVALARFEREAQATALLRSPHTVELYDFGVSDRGTFYFVMELLDGYNAQELIERFGPQPPERVIHLLLQVCDSLGEAHGAGLIHRDIKPSNICICRYGRRFDFVKVLDFGLVKLGGGPDGGRTEAQLTAEHVISGTPGFMSPEQALGGTQVDSRADVYSFGCLAFWLLTGHPVFRGKTVMEVLTQHLRDDPPPPSTCTNLPIPLALDSVVLRCLAKRPEDRPPSAEALASALADVRPLAAWTDARARDWWATVETGGSMSERGRQLREVLPVETRRGA